MARKYLIETFGCQMNVHDSERMAGLLEQAGYEATEEAAEADVVVINTCSVRERAEEKLYTRLGELRQLASEHGHDLIVGTQAIRRLPLLVDEARGVTNARPVPRIDLSPYDDVTWPLGVTRRGD